MLIDQMSVRQMRRLIFNACSYPFVDREYQPRTEEEKSAAYLVHEMMLNKTIMTLHYEMEQAERALQTPQNDGIITEETKGEQSNG
jgi:hypothetical protein